jgi:phosphatidylglycerol:prolipoprotein diacylglycerol transferase
MISYPHIDPEIVRFGPVAIRWYGLMYLIGFGASYFLVRHQIQREKLNLPDDFVESLYSYLVLGLLIGARLGYVIFYNPAYYFYKPLEIFALWHGGMSFHGGLIGSVIAGMLYCKKNNAAFWQTADMVIVTAPIGLGLGRLGNFINAELYGRVTDVPWAMIFPSGGDMPRHPSQLYELFLEGIVLFAVLWKVKDIKRIKQGSVTALFIILYGMFRFFVEFFREPDVQVGYILGIFTMGQILSGAMMIFGLWLFFVRQKAQGS